MNIIMWVLFGALVGWLASLIMHTNEEQGGLDNIIVGIIGAFIGGAVARFLGGSGVTGFNVGSILVAVAGAVLLIFLLRLIGGRRGRAS